MGRAHPLRGRRESLSDAAQRRLAQWLYLARRDSDQPFHNTSKYFARERYESLMGSGVCLSVYEMPKAKVFCSSFTLHRLPIQDDFAALYIGVVEFEFVVAAGEVGQGGVKPLADGVSATSVQSNVRNLSHSEMSRGQKERPDPRT